VSPPMAEPTPRAIAEPPAAVSVRRAGVHDLPSLDALNQVVQGLHADALPSMFKRPQPGGTGAFFTEALRRDDVVVLVAQSGDEVVGYLFAEEAHRLEGAFTLASHVLDIHHIVVDDAHRRTGAGRALVEAADAWAGDHGLTALRLDHWAFNDEADRFFTSLGFAVDNVRMSRPASGPGRRGFGAD
jgi:GNAT superfamily N-acetyltransferase